MNLSEYLSSGGDALSATALARAIGVSPALVYQWRTGRRPVPIEHCAAIEAATKGLVSRRDLRPDDYDRIWPELAEVKLSLPVRKGEGRRSFAQSTG